MRDVYLGNIVDITDPNCEFIKEFNQEIKKYGAIVYSYEQNCYQYIRSFSHINCKKEVLPDFIRVEKTDPLLKGLSITIHYEFDPESEEDPENLAIWNEEISQIELPYYNYDEQGELFEEKFLPFTTNESKYTIWFLTKASFDYILDIDLLLLTPIIKNLNIARELIRQFTVHPFENEYLDDGDFINCDLSSVYQKTEETSSTEKAEKTQDSIDFNW